MTSAVLIVSVTVAAAGVGRTLTTHEPVGHDRSAQLHSDKLTTSPRPSTPAPNHGHDELTTTASTIESTTTNHQNRFGHWRRAVPFPGAAVTGTAEAAKATPC